MSTFTGTYDARSFASTAASLHVSPRICWHGPHHEAVKYSMTGLPAAFASAVAAARSARQGTLSFPARTVFAKIMTAVTPRIIAKRPQTGLYALFVVAMSPGL